jgi:hypothetical protein
MAHLKQVSATWQRQQTALASSICRSAGRVLPVGKNSSGSSSKQEATSRQYTGIAVLEPRFSILGVSSSGASFGVTVVLLASTSPPGAVPAVVAVDVHVTQPGKGRIVGRNTCVGDLAAVTSEGSDVQGVSRRGIDGLAAASQRPEASVDSHRWTGSRVHPGEIRVNLVVVSLAVGGHIGTLSTNLWARQIHGHRLDPVVFRRPSTHPECGTTTGLAGVVRQPRRSR